ncbi:unnamed protein product, partial [Phaeothamnion confervicola]
PAGQSDAVIAAGEDARIDTSVERVIVVGGDVRLEATAHVRGDVIVLFGSVHRAPGARVDGSTYVVSGGIIDWIPGPWWVAGLLLVLALLAYRIAVWAAVCMI